MSAILSPCGTFRYRLERDDIEVDGAPGLIGARTACVIMVNPSTADAIEDDATIRKVKGFASRNDIGRVIVVNKLAYRAKDIRDIAKAVDPIGPENDAHIARAVRDADLTILAWGPVAKLPKYLRRRWLEVIRIAEQHRTNLYSIGIAQCGHPRHPLMTPYETPIALWSKP